MRIFKENNLFEFCKELRENTTENFQKFLLVSYKIMIKIKPEFSYAASQNKDIQIEIIRLYIQFFKLAEMEEKIAEL